MAYRPGQGTNREALERLRERRLASAAAVDLPAEDNSKQCDRLLGAGAKKVPRCSECTKPVSSHKILLCESCELASLPPPPPPPPPPQCRAARQRSLTPSTHADSDEFDHVFSPRLPRESRGLDPKPPDAMTLAVVKEVLEQLNTPGNNGFVWITGWNERFRRRLGTLRNFLESHPDKFEVIPQRGKGFRVAVAKDMRRQSLWQ